LSEVISDANPKKMGGQVKHEAGLKEKGIPETTSFRKGKSFGRAYWTKTPEGNR